MSLPYVEMTSKVFKKSIDKRKLTKSDKNRIVKFVRDVLYQSRDLSCEIFFVVEKTGKVFCTLDVEAKNKFLCCNIRFGWDYPNKKDVIDLLVQYTMEVRYTDTQKFKEFCKKIGETELFKEFIFEKEFKKHWVSAPGKLESFIN